MLDCNASRCSHRTFQWPSRTLHHTAPLGSHQQAASLPISRSTWLWGMAMTWIEHRIRCLRMLNMTACHDVECMLVEHATHVQMECFMQPLALTIHPITCCLASMAAATAGNSLYRLPMAADCAISLPSTSKMGACPYGDLALSACHCSPRTCTSCDRNVVSQCMHV